MTANVLSMLKAENSVSAQECIWVDWSTQKYT